MNKCDIIENSTINDDSTINNDYTTIFDYILKTKIKSGKYDQNYILEINGKESDLSFSFYQLPLG